jgi:sugar diacid utilization regulator
MEKTVNLDLTTIDGNAFMLMGAFRKQARREGWNAEEIETVMTECQSSDYDHLLQTLIKHCREDK